MKYKQFKLDNCEYIISNTGKIYSLRFKKWMKPYSTNKKYKKLYVKLGSFSKTFSVGKLVLTIFKDIGLPNETDFHINGALDDNYVKNLKWTTRSEIMRLAWKRKREKTNASVGVYPWKLGNKKFRAVMKINNKFKTIGYFMTKKEAVIAHKKRYIQLYGVNAL